MGTECAEGEQRCDVAKLVTDCVIEIIEISGSEIKDKANADLIKLIKQNFSGYDKVVLVTDNDGNKPEIVDMEELDKNLKNLSGTVVCKFYRKEVNLCIPWGIPRSELCKGVNGEVVCKLQLVKAIEGNIFDNCYIKYGNVKFLLQHYSKKHKNDGVAEYLRKAFVIKFSEIIKKCLDSGSPSSAQDLQKALQTSIDTDGTELHELFKKMGIYEHKVAVNGFVELNTEGG